MIFQLQFQLQLLIFFQLSYSYSYFLVTITVIRFFSFSYSYFGSYYSQLNAWKQWHVKTKKNTAIAYKAIILLLSLSKYQCQLVELSTNTLLWASQHDKPAIMHNCQCYYQCQYSIDLSIIFSVHFQECSLLKVLGETVSTACCQLPADRKHTFHVCWCWQQILCKRRQKWILQLIYNAKV